jgi:hypothetical protein
MGLLDDLLAGQNGASPWGVLYRPSPVTSESDQDRRAREAAMGGSMGIDPMSLPQTSPFGDPPRPPATPATPAPPGFGAGAIPFGFAGPGSMNVDPSTIAPQPSFGAGAKPVPFSPVAVTPQPPVGPGTVVPPRSPASSPRPPNDSVKIGNYTMPMFGRGASVLPLNAPQAGGGTTTAADSTPPSAPPDIDARLLAGLKGFAGGAKTGLLSAISGGVEGVSSGQAPINATAKALLAKGVPPQDIQAALEQPKVMEALINQHFGKQPSGAANTRSDGRGRIPR